jgi:competence protein ComEC
MKKLKIVWFCKYFFVLLVLLLIYKLVDREVLIKRIFYFLPYEEAGLLAGILLGVKESFSGEFYQKLKDIGVVHMVVVSGTHIMIISRTIIENLARFIGRKLAIFGGMGIIWIYVYLVGMTPSVIRAVLLVNFYYLAQVLGRKYNIFRGIVVVVLIMMLSDFGMWRNISFWLSITAFVAIVLGDRFKFNEFGRSFWISLFITPILSFSFGKISLIAPISNMLIFFVIEMLMIVGGLAMIFNFGLLFLLVLPILRYFIYISNYLSNYTFATIDYRFNIYFLIGWYLVLIGFVVKKRWLYVYKK